MNADANTPTSVPPEHALAASIGYLALEARREGFPLISHLLEVALYAIENHPESARLPAINLSPQTA